MSISQLIPSGLLPTAEQTETLLELAYLVTAVDGRLADEELVAFGVLAARLRGKEATTQAELDELLDRYGHNVDWEEEIEPRVRALAAALPKDLHAVAYRLALGLAFVDHEASEAEDRLHKVLGDALDLTPELRAALSRQVTLGGGKATSTAPPS
jgi:hypothetical protein